MAKESKLQKEIRKFLKAKGCDVLILNPGPGVPTGWEDITFFTEGFWGCIETKKAPNSAYRPLQEKRLERHHNWSWAKRVDPTTWPEIKEELEAIL